MSKFQRGSIYGLRMQPKRARLRYTSSIIERIIATQFLVMSEVSESIHLWRASCEQTLQVARAAGIGGWIIGANRRWTCFVPFDQDELVGIASSAPGIALHWSYFDDYGLRLIFFDGGTQLGEIGFTWGRMFGVVAPPHPTPSLLDSLERNGVLEGFENLQELGARVGTKTSPPRALRDRVADVLGLAAYEWLSPSYCRDMSIEELRRQFPDAEEFDSVDR